MALFGKKKEEQVEIAVAAEETLRDRKPVRTTGTKNDYAHILVHPHITEKATDNTARGVYVFRVASDANKKQIAMAIRQMYKVNPVKIRITRIPEKAVRNARTGISGVKSGGKKAYVYLKEGDSISVM